MKAFGWFLFFLNLIWATGLVYMAYTTGTSYYYGLAAMNCVTALPLLFQLTRG
jgi:hypothetical protein